MRELEAGMDSVTRQASVSVATRCENLKGAIKRFSEVLTAFRVQKDRTLRHSKVRITVSSYLGVLPNRVAAIVGSRKSA